MANPILLPRQGQSVESCIITEFYVKPGEKVTKDTPLFGYETDKASFEEVAQEDGTLLTWFFEEGDEVPVLTNVGVIGQEGESVDEFRPGSKSSEVQEGDGSEKGSGLTDAKEVSPDSRQKEAYRNSGEGSEKGSGVQSSEGSGLSDPREHSPDRRGDEPYRDSGVKVQNETDVTQNRGGEPAEPSFQGKVFISPRARNLSKSKGIDYRTIKGSGPNGRIIESDVRKALEHEPQMVHPGTGDKIPAAKEGTATAVAYDYPDPANTVYDKDSKIVPLTNIRKRIANAMHVSLQNSAQLTHHLGADARRILELRQQVKARQKEGYEHNITLNDMVCTAVIRTLKKYENANAHFLGESTRVFSKVHLGFAVDTERGLMVPAVKNADDLTIGGLSEQMKALADSCKKGSVNPDLLAPTEASFTVSNLGNYGVEMFTPVINLPQVAILGVNTILPRPKDMGNGTYGFVPHIGLSLTYDHRALDGGEATRFLKAIAIEIENLKITL